MEATAFSLGQRFIGLREYPAAETNPHIRAWLADAGIPNADDETPWCGAFLGYLAFLLGLPRPRGYARARSWLTVGTPIALEDASPDYDVIVLRRGKAPQPGPEVIAAPGHVGLFAAVEGSRVLILAGNQGDAVSIAPFASKDVLGVRRLV